MVTCVLLPCACLPSQEGGGQVTALLDHLAVEMVALVLSLFCRKRL